MAKVRLKAGFQILFVLHAWAALLVGAACPNHCSGHGTCGPGAKCSCNAGWDFAPDCSLREPRGCQGFAVTIFSIIRPQLFSLSH